LVRSSSPIVVGKAHLSQRWSRKKKGTGPAIWIKVETTSEKRKEKKRTDYHIKKNQK